MHFIIPDVTGDLILTKDESGYQEVLDSFATASSVTVVTYNISKNQDSLLGSLRGLEAEIRLITAIPSRFDMYYDSQAGRNQKINAAKAIKLYLQKLAPEEFGPLTSISFCFSNHAKVIMTDTVAYVGSANFSEESDNNWEVGILVRNPDSLKCIISFVDEIERNSVCYYGKKMLNSVAPLLTARQRLMELKDKLAEDFDIVERQDIKVAVEDLRDSIAESDRAWGEAFEESGPVYSRIDDMEISRVEDWHEDSLTVSELEEATQNFREAADGNIDAGSLRTDNDGNIPQAAFDAVVEDRQSERETCLIKAQEASADLQTRIGVICDQVEEVCLDISEHIKKIDNTWAE